MNEIYIGGIMWILWLLITGGIILLIIGLSKNVRNNQLSARDVLDKRYAAGEVNEAEYNKKKAMLESK